MSGSSNYLIRIKYNYYYYYYLLLESFSHQLTLMVFHGSLSDSKSPQYSRTFLLILAVLNNVVFWTVSTRPLISKSSSPFDNPLLIVTRAPVTTGMNVTFILHSFSISIKVEVLNPFHFLSVLISVQPGQQCPQFCKISFLLIIIIISLRVFFYISVSWRSFTEVWVIPSLLKCPGLFSVFWPFSVMLSFGWSPIVRQLPSPPVPWIIL